MNSKQSQAYELTLILCVFNEFERIQKSLPVLIKEVEEKRVNCEIIVIDNYSTDGTRQWLENDIVKVIFNNKNIGKGGSIRKGIETSKGEYLIIFDPDLEYASQSIWDCLNLIKEKKCKGVLGSRVLGGEVKYHYYLNRVGVQLLTYLINIFYNSELTDSATAIKMFETKFVQGIKFKRNGFNFDFEIVCRVLICGGKILEVPVEYFPRTFSEGKKISAFKDGFQSLVAIASDRFKKRSQLLKKNRIE